MSSRISEKKLLRPVKKYLLDLGCLPALAELRFFDRGIDLYAVAQEGGSYAIELKVTDWQKALRQAAIYQLCADFCYVAMPSQHTAKVDLDGFRQAGVGLLGVCMVSKAVTEILPAKASVVKHNLYSSGFQHSFQPAERCEANGKRSA